MPALVYVPFHSGQHTAQADRRAQVGRQSPLPSMDVGNIGQDMGYFGAGYKAELKRQPEGYRAISGIDPKRSGHREDGLILVAASFVLVLNI
jgi:hypothetical protein